MTIKISEKIVGYELVSADEQAEQITVAFADCHQMCSPSSAHDYVWPLLIDKATGQCD